MVLYYNIPQCFRCTSKDIAEVKLSEEESEDFRALCVSRKMTKEEGELLGMPTDDNEENRKIVYDGLEEYLLHQTNSLKKVIN